ncbi:hypothetical protein PHK61_20725 [Actinomycetospora lutea]|uniref:hypothetical protein n=1 Tax=Actinomycetospora lutea TaxID=663604 RepID=UPI00236575E8|nr:hypothetical protein [Actinomycetospora lutea]MDD7940851.1 hypothetical protein [Actinomycetospora lutea]
MGQHSARRSGGAMTTVAGRGLFTATAAVALLGGGTSMAVAGEAPSSGGHEHAQSGSEHAQGGESGSCEIPVVDATVESGESTVNAVTGDATAPVFEAGGQVTQPVHDAACPPASELLGPILGGAPASADAEEATPDEATPDEATSEEETSDESPQAASSETPETPESPEASGSGAPMELPIQ